PEWVSDPFAAARPRATRRKSPGPDASSFRVFRALVQRGKGGVYQAVDLRGDAPRLCLLKEGRKGGELGWDGRDGARRVRHEERVILSLLAAGVDAPRIYSSFSLGGNYYLVTEFIEGESLHGLLARRERRMPVRLALRYGLRLSEVFRGLHAAGWVWRDCKPANILVTPEGRLRPIDFEGACPTRRPDPLYWGTPGFTPPEWREREFSPRASRSGDVYALGSVLYLLLTGRVPEAQEPAPVESLRGDVPAGARALVMRLLGRDPDSRPRAEEVVRELEAALSSANGGRPAPVGRSCARVSAAAATGG
ncbi:MAG TPA: serine/threonine-protein kinase, partial [Pyrinomonadaceae bacterium]|nr:serine/threonine-protein kinase [Pyrinomonadaceae bacterium]